MSLICIKCKKTIVLSDTPDHYGVCSSCPLNLSVDEKRIIQQGSLW